MKRIIAMLLCSAMLAVLAGCSVSVSKPDPDATPGVSVSVESTTKPEG